MKSRDRAIQSVRRRSFDLCIIGGGATGLGCALDAQLRGISTVLIESADFVSCTSMASTKLVHGGVRYLQQAVRERDRAQYALVRRALCERLPMLRRAPYLAHPIELLVPCYSLWELAYYAIGLKLYDWLAGALNLFPSRLLWPAEAHGLFAGLRPEKLRGCVSYADGQFDDARFGLALAQTFSQQGGELVNYTKVVGFERSASGQLLAAEVEDQLTGERFPLRASLFLNCTGPFSDQLRRLANPSLPERLRLSRGVHLLLPLPEGQGESALLIPRTDDGRVLFAIPWQGRLLVGTTDEEAAATDELAVTPAETEYLLRHVNRYLQANFTVQDVHAAFTGLRPLLKSTAARETATLSRDHEVEIDPASGLISVLGGKWTTYRAMAEDAIDAVERALGRSPTPCKTMDFALTGSADFWSGYWQQLAEKFGLSANIAHHLASKFGTDAPRVLALAENDAELLQPLCDGAPVIAAEVLYGIREEMAQSIEDILLRRTGLQLYGWHEAAQAAPAVVRLLARELGWSESQSSSALAAYLANLTRQMSTLGIECSTGSQMQSRRGV